jgi:hypothetical protein
MKRELKAHADVPLAPGYYEVADNVPMKRELKG